MGDETSTVSQVEHSQAASSVLPGMLADAGGCSRTDGACSGNSAPNGTSPHKNCITKNHAISPRGCKQRCYREGVAAPPSGGGSRGDWRPTVDDDGGAAAANRSNEWEPPYVKTRLGATPTFLTDSSVLLCARCRR